MLFGTKSMISGLCYDLDYLEKLFLKFVSENRAQVVICVELTVSKVWRMNECASQRH